MSTVRGIIYLYISPSTKCYVGQTINEKSRRYKFLNQEHYSSTKFDRARMKHRPENFIYEIIYEDWFDTAEDAKNVLNELEKYYIQLYDSFKNGYNATPGGEGSAGGEHHPAATSVIIFDLYARPIKAFKTLDEAMKELNFGSGLYYKKPKTYYERFCFRTITREEYELFNKGKLSFEPENTDCLRYVAQIDMKSKQIIKCFSNSVEAKAITKITTINKALSGQQKSAGGYN